MLVNWWRITFSHISTNQRRNERLKHSEKPIQFLQICNNANLQNVQRVQYVLHQISNMAAALLNLPKQLPAPLPQNHSCHQGDLQWRHHKVVNLPALEKKVIQLLRDGVTSLTPESRDIFSLHTAQTGKKVQEK